MQKRIFIFCERPPTQSRDEGCLRTKRREEMKRIKLFADNMSTGLWDATTNQSIHADTRGEYTPLQIIGRFQRHYLHRRCMYCHPNRMPEAWMA